LDVLKVRARQIDVNGVGDVVLLEELAVVRAKVLTCDGGGAGDEDDGLELPVRKVRWYVDDLT